MGGTYHCPNSDCTVNAVQIVRVLKVWFNNINYI